MIAKTFLYIRGKKEGPFSHEEIQEKLKRGEIGLYDLVLKDGKNILIKQFIKDLQKIDQESNSELNLSENPSLNTLKRINMSSSGQKTDIVPEEGVREKRESPRFGGYWSKTAAGVSGLVGMIILFYNVGVLTYNTYLQTDQAAIMLIKESMQEKLDESQDVAKPVRVVEVKLNGNGLKRNGKALIEFAGKPESLPFKVDISRSIFKGVEVKWEFEKEAGGAQAARQDAALSKEEAELGRNKQSFNEIEESLANFIKAAVQIDVLNKRLVNPESHLSDQETNRHLSELIEAWKTLIQEGGAIGQLIGAAQKAGFEPDPNEKIQLKTFEKVTAIIKTSGPAIEALLVAALETADKQIYEANMNTYFELSVALSDAMADP